MSLCFPTSKLTLFFHVTFFFEIRENMKSLCYFLMLNGLYTQHFFYNLLYHSFTAGFWSNSEIRLLEPWDSTHQHFAYGRLAPPPELQLPCEQQVQPILALFPGLSVLTGTHRPSHVSSSAWPSQGQLFLSPSI